MISYWCDCYEGELIHRFGSSSLAQEQDTDTFHEIRYL